MKINFDELFRKLDAKSNTVIQDKERLKNLISDTIRMAKNNKELSSIWQDLKITLEMIRTWMKGDYEELGKGTIIMVIGGLLYLINPLDLIPDFLIGGFLDDAAVLAYVFKKIANEISGYKKWKSEKEDIIETIEIVDEE